MARRCSVLSAFGGCDGETGQYSLRPSCWPISRNDIPPLGNGPVLPRGRGPGADRRAGGALHLQGPRPRAVCSPSYRCTRDGNQLSTAGSADSAEDKERGDLWRHLYRGGKEQGQLFDFRGGAFLGPVGAGWAFRSPASDCARSCPVAWPSGKTERREPWPG
jgi:hypothetical protein